jgi:protein-S-isoprenylcysteine O-methyltransferase Ste14
MNMTPRAGDELTFQIIFAVIFCTSLAASAYHRLKARTGEPLDRRQEGVLVFALLRLGGLAAGLSALAFLIDPAWRRSMYFPAPIWLRWFGAAVGLFAPALLFWTLHHLGRNFTDTVVTRVNAHLVSTGPYAWVRHPFYVAAGLLIFSSVLVTTSWVLGVAGMVVLMTLALRTATEEKYLLARFGPEYRVYADRTGRFIPRFRR